MNLRLPSNKSIGILAVIFIMAAVVSSLAIELYLHLSYKFLNNGNLLFHILNVSIFFIFFMFIVYIIVSNYQIRQKDNKLRQSNENLSLITNLNGIGYAIFNLNTQQFQGYDGSANLSDRLILWEEFLSFIHPKDTYKFLSLLKQMENKESEHYEIECRYKPFGKGEYQWYVIDVAVSPYKGRSSFDYYLFLFRNNDPWHKAQESLTYYRKQVSFISSMNGIMFIIYDVARDLFYRLDDSADLKRHEIPMMLWQKSFHPDDLDKQKELLSFLREHRQESFHTEYRYMIPRSGKYVWFTIHVVASERDDNNQISRYMCLALDSNSWHELNDNLTLFKDEVSLVSSSCHIIFSQYDVASHTIRFLNDSDSYSTKKLYSWDMVKQGVCHDDLNNVQELEKFLTTHKGREFTTEYRYKFPNETEYRWFMVNVVACNFDGNGNITRYIIQGRDNHDLRNALEKMRELRDRAELENRLKTSFLENITHEIRTPLNAIIGFSDLICDEDSAEIRKEYKDIIRKNNSELLHIVNDVINLSKLESGTSKLNRLNFDVTDFFLNIVDSLKVGSNADIVCQNNLRFNVILDPLRLNDVITALLKNAITFSKGDAHVELNYHPKDDGLYVEVVDNGIGIGEKDLDRIFERFEKVNPFGNGTGLGLSICKTIVEQSGGHIGVRSKVGEGSTFWFWLPCEVK